MFYKGERVYTMKEFKKIIGVKSYRPSVELAVIP